jgi:hypothetical protein
VAEALHLQNSSLYEKSSIVRHDVSCCSSHNQGEYDTPVLYDLFVGWQYAAREYNGGNTI